MPSFFAVPSALLLSLEAIAAISLHSPFCIAGTALASAKCEVLKTPHRALLAIGSPLPCGADTLVRANLTLLQLRFSADRHSQLRNPEGLMIVRRMIHLRRPSSRLHLLARFRPFRRQRRILRPMHQCRFVAP